MYKPYDEQIIIMHCELYRFIGTCWSCCEYMHAIHVQHTSYSTFHLIHHELDLNVHNKYCTSNYILLFINTFHLMEMRDNTRLKRYPLLHTCRTPIQLRKSLVLIFISIYLVPIHVQLIRAVIWRTMNFNCRLSTCIHYIKFGLELCQQYFCFPLLTLS